MEEQCCRRVTFYELFIKYFNLFISIFFICRKNSKNPVSQNRRPSGGGNKKTNETVEYFG